jgi:hypothetical protein
MSVFSLSGAVQQKLLVIIALCTLVLVGYFSYTFVSDAVLQRQRNHAEALRIAEYGLQQVLAGISSEPVTAEKTVEQSESNGTYQVKIIPVDSNTIEIKSQGTIGSITRHIRCLVRKTAKDGQVNFAVEKWDEE